MASSPPAGFQTPITNSKKRPSLSTNSSAIASKKPRLSHPLRQTSFPASDATTFYKSAGPPSARSETGSVTASVFSTTSTNKPAPRGRGRPRKSAVTNTDETQTNNDESSQNNRNAGARSVVSANAKDGNADDADENEDDDIAHYTSTEADAFKQFDEAQTQKRDRLKSVLDSDSLVRFEKWRSASLNKPTVRRLVNQIVSQSVTENPIQAVRVSAKWFVAEIVESAREVQIEAAVAYEDTISKEREDRKARLDKLRERFTSDAKLPENERMSEYDRRRLQVQIDKAKRESEEYIPNPHKGGLLPDHLREALRRYRADGEGGGVGFEGLSHPLLGAHGSRIWGVGDATGGRRMFR